MRKLHISEIIVLLLATIFSGVGFVWLVIMDFHPPTLLSRIQFVCSVIATLWLFMAAWMVTGVVVLKKLNSFPDGVTWIFAPFWIASVLCLFSDNRSIHSMSGFLMGNSVLAVHFFRRYFLPPAQQAESSRPPLSLFGN